MTGVSAVTRVVSVLMLMAWVGSATALIQDYPTFYAEDICDQKLTLGSEPSNSTLVIKLLKENSSSAIKWCKVDIESTNDYRIHTNIKNMIDSFRELESKSQNSITFTKLNSDRRLIIEFNGLGDDIHIVVTAYKYVNEGQNCPKHHFLCEKNKCIHESYRCDSYFNCANDENELACALDLTPGNTILMTIILSILTALLGTACLLTTYIYYRYYRHKDSLLDKKQILYGTVNSSVPVSVQHSMKVYK